jgi:hypothetical protein
MANEIKIFYNNIDLFSGIGPIPFVSFSQEFIDFNTKWNQITRLSLDGQLTGQYLGSNSNAYLNQGVANLINRLSNNYGKIEIFQNSSLLYENNYCVIDNINFDENNWYGILPYTIDIIAYESGLFTNFYGIVEPEETISYSEDDGEIINLTHTISAKGVYNNLSALQNAKNWVSERKNKYDKILPFLIKTGIGSNFILNSTNETVDRFNGVYTYESNYIKSNNVENPKNSLLNYSIDINSGIQDNFINCAVNGSLEKSSINNLRLEYSGINFHNLANQTVLQIYKTNLNQNPIYQSIKEQPEENKINFSIIYNNDFDSNIINDYTVDINKDALKNISEVTLNANISCKYGDIEKKWSQVKDFFEKKFRPFNLANNEYKKENSKKLFSNTIRESITFDEYNATITYTAVWSDKRKISDDVVSFSSSVEYTPSIRLHVSNPSSNTKREHNVQNLNTYSRSKLDISVSLQLFSDINFTTAETLASGEIARIKDNYRFGLEPLLENRNVKKNTENKFLSINETWSFQGLIVGATVI